MIRVARSGDPLRLGVLVSGTGTNLQALLDASSDPTATSRVVAVAATRPSIPALERAHAARVPAEVFARGADNAARDAALAEWLARHRVELVVCAGWMGLLDAAFLRRFVVINVHPSLLPAFPGTAAVTEALRYGVRVTGVTVFLVDDGIDTGPILLQEAVAVAPTDDAATLLRRLHRIEHRLLRSAIGYLATDRVAVAGRSVRIRPAASVPAAPPA